MVVCGVLGLSAGLVAGLIAPKIYEARAEIWIQGDDPERAKRNLGDSLSTQLAILRSEGVYKTALQRVAARKKDKQLKQDQKRLFEMYRVDVEPRSAVAQVRVRAYAPQTAADLANELARTYRSKRASATNQTEAARQQSYFDRMDRAKTTLEDSERRLSEYKSRTNAPDLNQKTGETIRYEAGLTARLDSARAELQQTEGEIRTINSEIRKRPEKIEESKVVGKNRQLEALEDKLSDLQRQRIDLTRTYAITSSKVTAIDEAIAETERQVMANRTKPWETRETKETVDPQRMSLERERAAKMARRSALSAEVSETTRTLGRVRAEMSLLPAAQQSMQRLQRDYDLALNRLQKLQQEALALDTQKVDEAGTAATLKAAEPDKTPVSPNIPLLMLLGGALGAVGAGIYTFATDRSRKPVRSSLDLEHLGLTAGVALALPKREEERRLRELPDPAARSAEAYRFMALSMPPGEGSKAVLFTGVGGKAGCSSAAGQFALALASEGRPTLLVDCDFRLCELTKVFHSSQKPGLSDILRKTLLPSQDNDMPMQTSHNNLSFLPSGSSGDGSIADFSHAQLRAAIDMLKEQADMIILDSPPCDQVTDAVRLAPLVDQVVLVVDAESTESDKVAMANRLLKQCGAKDIRVMLTGGDPRTTPFSSA